MVWCLVSAVRLLVAIDAATVQVLCMAGSSGKPTASSFTVVTLALKTGRTSNDVSTFAFDMIVTPEALVWLPSGVVMAVHPTTGLLHHHRLTSGGTTATTPLATALATFASPEAESSAVPANGMALFN